MKTEAAKRIVAEWLEEQTIPALVPRDAGKIDLERASEILAVVGPRRAGKTWYMYQLINELLAAKTCEKDDILSGMLAPC